MSVNELLLPTRYIASEEKKQGGFGSVYTFKDLNLDRDVAIKVTQKKSELKRLGDEISALLKLRSKHVVQVYDVVMGIEDNFGIVMEYINGNDLFEIKLSDFSHLERLKLLWQICCGINDIHEVGIIHRDIKPNNMKLDDEGILKIFDFGLSRESEVNAKTQGFKGTFGFAAPEQYSNGDINFTKAVDVYAFGVMALYIFTGNVPLELQKIPPHYNPDFFINIPELSKSDHLKDLLASCLNLNPMTRPEISDIKNELSKALLFNKHQAVAVINGNTNFLDQTSPRVNLQLPGIGSFEIHYSGYDFWIKNAVGEIYMNNIHISTDQVLVGSCVVALGSAARSPRERSFVTFDVSTPEVAI